MKPGNGRKRRTSLDVGVGLLAALLGGVLLAGCGGSTQVAAGADGGQSRDKLAQVLARGTLVLSTDPEYPPQSSRVAGAARRTGTSCAANQLTAPEMTGFDAETGKLVAKALGVEPCFVTPNWAEIVSGNWGDRWDISWGSGAINGDRMTRLWMTQPYRAEPSRFFVRASSPYRTPSDLDGKTVGACTGCTHELYLRHTLSLPGVAFTYLVAKPRVQTYDVETGGLAAVAAGKIDAFLCAEQVGKEAIASGAPLRALDEIAFTSMLTGFVDKKSGLASGPFVRKVDSIIAQLHKAGTLARLSTKVFGVDYTKAAGAFDMSGIKQTVR